MQFPQVTENIYKIIKDLHLIVPLGQRFGLEESKFSLLKLSSGQLN